MGLLRDGVQPWPRSTADAGDAALAATAVAATLPFTGPLRTDVLFGNAVASWAVAAGTALRGSQPATLHPALYYLLLYPLAALGATLAVSRVLGNHDPAGLAAWTGAWVFSVASHMALTQQQ